MLVAEDTQTAPTSPGPPVSYLQELLPERPLLEQPLISQCSAGWRVEQGLDKEGFVVAREYLRH